MSNYYVEWYDERCSLAVDQQFTTVCMEDKVYRILIDGEIYNEAEIKKTLLHRGMHFVSDCLEEIVIGAYHEWNKGMMTRLIGAYSIIIDDGKEVFVTKDPMGLRPVFYVHEKGKHAIVANSLQQILEHHKELAKVDRNGLRELFAFGPSISEEKTLYQKIHALPMGHYMVFQKDKLQVKRYYKPIAKPHFDSLEETKAKIRYLVEEAVRMQSKDCKATFLSGGLDSSILASLMAKEHAQIETYSLDYEGNAENFQGNLYQVSLDDAYIDAMVNATASKHTKYTITQTELVQRLKDAMYHRGVPGMADVDASLLWLCEQVKKEQDVILSGECSDEVFGGYPWFYKEELRDVDTFPWLRSLSERKALLHDQLQDLDLEGYIQEQYQKTCFDIDYLETDREDDRLARKQTNLCLRWFMQTLVTRQVTMGEGSEVMIRAPFADIRILDYVYNIPWDMKFYGEHEKGILRETFAEDLPQEVAYRKKNPFPKTHNPIYAEQIAQQLQEVLKEDDSILHQLCDAHALQELIRTKGESFPLPWYGQLMSGPQLLAYLYQIDQWARTYAIDFSL